MKIFRIQKNRSGFTLVEFLVSTAIIGVISTIFIVNVSKSTKDNEIFESIQVINDEIRDLQNLALSSTQGHAWGMYAEIGDSDFIIFSDDNDNTDYDGGEEVVTVNMPASVVFDGTAGFNNFVGWDYANNTMRDANAINYLRAFFYPPDSKVEIYLETNSGTVYQVSYTEFSLRNTESLVEKEVRINNYGLFEVLD